MTVYRNAGRKALPDGEKKISYTIMIKPEYKDYYQKHLGNDWLESKILQEINQVPTEKELFTMYAAEKGVFTGYQTIKELLDLYEREKYSFGWDAIIEIFKEAGKKIFEKECAKELNNSELSDSEKKLIQKTVIDDFKKNSCRSIN